jgi:large subunit ribosomal protein L3
LTENTMHLLARKLKMTQLWRGSAVVPVTVLQAEPNTVSLVRTKQRDGYEAVQLLLGKKTKREFRTNDTATMTMGQQISVAVFKEGDVVAISGLTRGRGFQGGVKRHGFGGGPKTHGQKNRLRAPGSLGSTAPQRVVPGRKMAGHMGQERVTIKNISVVAVDEAQNTISLKGAVPGARGTLIEIRKISRLSKNS